MDYFKKRYKEYYDHNLKCIDQVVMFPSNCVYAKQRDIRWYNSLVDGSYANNLFLDMIVNGSETSTPFRITSLNYYQLTVNKLLSIALANKATIKTGDSSIDARISKLAESVNIDEILLNLLTKVSIEGSVLLKTYKKGISVISIENGFVVLDENTGDTKYFILYEILTSKEEVALEAIRFEVHMAGQIVEFVKQYAGTYFRGTLGQFVDYKYKDRFISKFGNYYETKIEMPLVSLCAINKATDKVYGESCLAAIQPVISAIEIEMTQSRYIQENNANPILLVGMSAINRVESDEGDVIKLKTADGKLLVQAEGDPTPKYIEYGGESINNSKVITDSLMNDFFRLSEMSEALLSAKFTGQVSEETFSNLMSGIIEKVNRYWIEIKTDFKDAFFKLCLLNDINVDYNDLSIELNVAHPDDGKVLAEIAKTLKESEILSHSSILQKVYGYTEDAAINEIDKIKKEGN